MLKTIAAGLTMISLTCSSLAYAQNPSAAASEHEHWRPSAADFNALTEARIAALKAGLQLTPEQAKHWPAVEESIRVMAMARQVRLAARHDEQHHGDAIERLREHADAMAQRAAELKKLADVAQPLYESLNEDQKHRLHLLVRMLRPHWDHHAGWHEHHGFDAAEK
jgi:zinc resistance-associated protein